MLPSDIADIFHFQESILILHISHLHVEAVYLKFIVNSYLKCFARTWYSYGIHITNVLPSQKFLIQT
jgi:hypothetical protein